MPWGTSFGYFYQTEEELLAVLAPYFKAGLESNEYCVWVTPKWRIGEGLAKVLGNAIPHYEEYAKKRQIELVPHSQWYARNNKAGETIIARLDDAVSRGFDGLRLAVHVLEEKSRRGPRVHAEVSAISRYNAIAVFAYPRDHFGAAQLMEAVKDYRFALVQNAGRLEVIESSEARIVRDALRISEEKLSSLFSHMAEGFAYHRLVLDDDSKPCDYVFLEVNNAFERLTGLKAEDIIGRRVTNILPDIEKDPTDWIGKFGQVALTGQPVRFESYSVPLKKWYAVSAFSPHKGFFAVTFNDITPQKQAAERLRYEAVRFKILSEANGLLLTTEDPQEIIQPIASSVMAHLDCDVFFNYILDQRKGRLRLNACAGVPAETAREIEWLDLGEAICGYVARDGCRIVSENVQENGDAQAALARSFGMQVYACHPLHIGNRTIGTLSFGSRSRTRFADDELEFMRTVAGQVSLAMQRKETERSLAESEMRLKKSQELAHLGSWELDLRTNILTWSDEVYRIFGLRPQEFGATYEAFLEAVHPDDRQAVDAAYSGSVREGRDTYEIEHRVVRKNRGEIRYVMEKCEHFRDETGRIIKSIGMVHDITDIRQAQEEIRQRTAELEASNRELEAFSYSVSHDLRSPLRSIEGFSTALLEDYADKLDEEGKRYLGYIKESSDLMARLIDDILRLSRVTRSDMNREFLDLGEIVRNVALQLQAAEPDRQVAVSIAPGITGYGDSSLLRLVFQNLLGNAWKFTGKVASPRIEVGKVNHNGKTACFVRDNGVGFDMTYADKLFKPFQRLHKASEFSGTGIGLATVQRIIGRHGGEVWAEGRPGEGATFYFTLG